MHGRRTGDRGGADIRMKPVQRTSERGERRSSRPEPNGRARRRHGEPRTDGAPALIPVPTPGAIPDRHTGDGPEKRERFPTAGRIGTDTRFPRRPDALRGPPSPCPELSAEEGPERGSPPRAREGYGRFPGTADEAEAGGRSWRSPTGGRPPTLVLPAPRNRGVARRFPATVRHDPFRELARTGRVPGDHRCRGDTGKEHPRDRTPSAPPEPSAPREDRCGKPHDFPRQRFPAPPPALLPRSVSSRVPESPVRGGGEGSLRPRQGPFPGHPAVPVGVGGEKREATPASVGTVLPPAGETVGRGSGRPTRKPP